MKKLFAVLLLLAMTLCAAGAGAEDHEHRVSSKNLQCDCGYYGSCGDGVEWELVDGTLTISKTVGGTGAMEDYTSGGAPWYDKGLQITSVVIGDGVTSIGASAFWSCSALTSVEIPEGVTSIGNYAFNFTGLTSVTIPASVQTIGREAFYLFGSLKSVTFAEGSQLTSIGAFAFFNAGLTNVTIPASVTSIGYRAFYGCTSLTTVTIPDSVTSIGEGAFNNCQSLTSVTIPDSVTSIGEGAFNNCQSLTSVTFEGNAPKTANEGTAFMYCANLTTINVPWNWEGPVSFRISGDKWLTVTRGPAPALPTTGDSSSLALWLALLMLAALGAAAMRKRTA